MGTTRENQAGKTTMPDNFRSMNAHIGLCILYGVLGFSLIVLFGSESGGVSIIGAALFVLMLCLLHGVIAFGAALAAHWARKSSMAIGCLMLFGFPIGTLIGVYLLVNLKWPSTEQAMK